MRSIASCFKMIFMRPLLSKALMMEDFRRYWLIPFIAFAAYFFSSVFPILMSYRELDISMGNHIRSLLHSQNPLILFFNVLLPVIAATTLYRYMHTTSSASVVHAMPFNRNTLFNSHFISGYCMSLLPVLLNGVILLLISKPVYWNPQTGSFSGIQTTADGSMMVNVFAHSQIMTWMWQSALIIAVIYAITAFTTSVTGNSIMHFVLAGIFIVLTPGLLAVLTAYFDYFLHGYITSEGYTNFIMGINPVLQTFRQTEDHFAAGWIIWYLASILGMYLLGNYLYLTKKLERATESITFRPLSVYMSYIASFFGMTALGFYLYAMGRSNEVYLYLGFAAGTIIVYLVAEVIITRSWNIFNKKTFIRLGAYFVIATTFLLGLNFDVTGYERRIPLTSEVTSAYFYEPAFANILDTGYNRSDDRENRVELKTEENIKAVLRLHETMVARRNLSHAQRTQWNSYALTHFYFDYRMKNDSFLTRSYGSLPMQAFVVDNADLKTIMESEEYKSQILLHSFYPKGGRMPESSQTAQRRFDQIDISGYGDLRQTLSDTSELVSFHDSLKADLMARNFEEMLMPSGTLISLNYRMLPDEEGQITHPDSYSSAYGVYNQGNSSNYYVSIDSSFRNTISWLKEKGYYDDLILNPASVRYITIDKIIFDENGYPIQTGDPDRDYQLKMEEMMRAGLPIAVEDKAYVSEISETPPAPTATKMVVTDQAQIQKIMDTYNHANSPASALATYTVRIYASIPDVDSSDKEHMNFYTGGYYDMTIPAEFASYFK